MGKVYATDSRYSAKLKRVMSQDGLSEGNIEKLLEEQNAHLKKLVELTGADNAERQNNHKELMIRSMRENPGAKLQQIYLHQNLG
ncbi:MAG: hypothetical protein K2Z81_05250, partial [Cyanobacteria bacterium]|nr:hypothetical protein [Cyanobacteriota bacterium]